MGKDKGVIFATHAMERFRERWPDCTHMDQSTVRGLIRKQIAEADKNDDFAICEGGIYYPITILGKDGYAVVQGNKITTILPEEYCAQVKAVIEQKRSGVNNAESHPPRANDLDRPTGTDG